MVGHVRDLILGSGVDEFPMTSREDKSNANALLCFMYTGNTRLCICVHAGICGTCYEVSGFRLLSFSFHEGPVSRHCILSGRREKKES